MEGWIKLHRQIVDNPYYFSEPFNRTLAWIDLLILANHKDNFFYKRGIKVEVKRGQVGYDLEKLALRWKWSRGKAERFFLELEMSGQVVRQKTNITTLFTIVKYNEYQQDDKPNNKASSKPNSKANGHQTVKQTDTNNNDKNGNNDENENKKLPFSSSEFFDAWKKLIKEPKWKKKTPSAIEKSLEKLSKYSESDAIEMINNAIIGGWQGLFEPKGAIPKKDKSEMPQTYLNQSNNDY